MDDVHAWDGSRTLSLFEPADEDPVDRDPNAQPQHTTPAAKGPQRLGPYILHNIVGRGAFALVYRATREDDSKTYALKVFRLHKSARNNPGLMETALKRFHREAHLAGQLNHPNTVALYGCEQSPEGIVYMVFEFIDGPTLSEEIKAHPDGISPDRTIRIARQVAQSLQEAHSKGIIHRDMKPSNIMLQRDAEQPDTTKVLDFGIAKILEDSSNQNNQTGITYRPEYYEDLDALSEVLTQDGKIVGTPRYIPPEQILGKDLTPSADLYSLGLIMYEMLTGVSANPGKDAQEMIKWHMHPTPPQLPPGKLIPAGLMAFLNRATKRPAHERFTSADQFLHALDALGPNGELRRNDPPPIVAIQPVPSLQTSPPPPLDSSPSPTRRNLILALLLLLILGLLAAGFFLFTPEPSTPPPLTPNAQSAQTPPASPPTDLPSTPSQPTTPTTPSPEQNPTETTTAQPTPTPSITITSNPTGAMVLEGNKHIGNTPLTYTIQEAQPVDLVLSKAGYYNARLQWKITTPMQDPPTTTLRKRKRNRKQ